MRFRPILLLFGVAAIAGVIAGAMLGRVDGVDENQARICRAIIPAIAGDRATIAVTRIAPASPPGSLRVDYRAEEPGRPSRPRHVICTFAGGGFGLGRAELVAVATERGRMSESAFFFLRRFWLDQPEASLQTPARPASRPLLGRVSANGGYAIQQAASALPLITVTGLMATAYALVYGLVGRIIMAFGEFAVLGAAGVALGVAVAQSSGVASALPLVAIGLLFGGWITATWGAAAARLVLAPILRQPGQQVLIATVGLALAMSETIRLTQGHNARWLSPLWNNPIVIAEAPDFSATTTPMTLAVAVAAFAAAVALVVAMRAGRYGREWRACADDPVAASLCGVDMRRTALIAFALACGVAGFCGFLLTLHIGGMGFSGGAVFGLKALVGAILGGVGSVGGALAGGLAVGALEALWSATMPLEWRDVLGFTLLSLVLIFRPGGFFGDGQAKDPVQGRAT